MIAALLVGSVLATTTPNAMPHAYVVSISGSVPAIAHLNSDGTLFCNSGGVLFAVRQNGARHEIDRWERAQTSRTVPALNEGERYGFDPI